MVEEIFLNTDTVYVSLLHPSGTRSQLDCEISAYYGSAVLQVAVNFFADSELSFTCDDYAMIQGKPVVVLAQFSFGESFRVNEQLFLFYVLASLLKKEGACSITYLMPYLPYSRQDFDKGSSSLGAIEQVVSLFSASGVTTIIVFDIHNEAILPMLSPVLFSISLDSLWSAFLKERVLPSIKDGGKSIAIAAADGGGAMRASRVAHELSLPLVRITKERYGADKSRVLSLEGDVKDKVVIIIDDIIDTGLTALNAAHTLNVNGASTIIGCFTHGIFSRDALEQLAVSSFNSLYVTDSIASVKKRVCGYGAIEVVCLASFFGKKLKDGSMFKKIGAI